MLRTGFRSLLGSPARKRCGSDRRQPALREYIPRRPVGDGGRYRDGAWSGGQRGGRDRCSEPEFSERIRRRGGILREFVFTVCQYGRLPATPVSITAVPSGKLHAPYFMQWSLAIEHREVWAARADFKAQYVGTRAVDQPYTTQVNGYQTVCSGCFAPFAYGSPPDSRFGAVTQLSTGANSNYNGLQVTVEKRLSHGLRVPNQLHVEPLHGHGFEWRLSASFPRPALLRRFLAISRVTEGHAITTFATICTGNYVYQLPWKVKNRVLARAVNGWQASGTAFFHSGVPLFGAERALHGERQWGL